MTDFVRRVLRPQQSDFVIRSLLDVDFYKYTMLYFIFRFFRGVRVKFQFINRHVHVPLAHLIDEGELRRQLDHVMTLRLTQSEIFYLRGQNVYYDNMFSEDFLEFLQDLQLGDYHLERVGDQYLITFEGPWECKTLWETICLTIVNTLLYRALMQTMTETELDVLYARARLSIYDKLIQVKSRPTIRFADFGTRRRHNFLWHQMVVKMAREILGPQYTGTSNVYLANLLAMFPIGTYAHELVMVIAALAKNDEELLDAQYLVLRLWAELFPKGGLRVFLPDTFGSKQFYQNMPKDLAPVIAREWRGPRLDSGDPIEEGNLYLNWVRQFDVDPIRDGKIVIPSDGINIESMFEIDDAFTGVIDHPYGWGTFFTNGFEGCHPRLNERVVINGREFDLTWAQLFCGHSLVCKAVEANGRAAVKISNNPTKGTGDLAERKRYMRRFGTEAQVARPALV